MKILLTLFVLLFVGFALKAYSSCPIYGDEIIEPKSIEELGELPSLFGIQLGKEHFFNKTFESDKEKVKRISQCLQSELEIIGRVEERGDTWCESPNLNECILKFYDVYDVEPPMPSAFFQQYSIKSYNNIVVEISAHEPRRNCFTMFDSITSFEETILKEIKLKFGLGSSSGILDRCTGPLAEILKEQDSLDICHRSQDVFLGGWSSDNFMITATNNKEFLFGNFYEKDENLNSCSVEILLDPIFWEQLLYLNLSNDKLFEVIDEESVK